MPITLASLVNSGVPTQNSYATRAGLPLLHQLTDKQRCEQLIVMIAHAGEELQELRQLLPRRYWRNEDYSVVNTPEFTSEFASELADVLLMARAIAAYANISGEQLEEALERKLVYNSTRVDHLSHLSHISPTSGATAGTP